MQKEDRTGKGVVYSRGFFAFLCGAAVIGLVLGTMCCCLADKGLSGSTIGYFADTIIKRSSMEQGRLLAESLWGNTVFLLGTAVLGLCPVGQPFELALLVIRGMGLGYSMAQLYSLAGREMLGYCMGLMLPGAVIGLLGLIAAVREALCLSGIYLRMTLSDKPVQGLSQTIKLYGAKLLAAEAVLALAAGADTVCNYLFIGRLGI